MTAVPLRVRAIDGERALFTNDAGRFFAADLGFLGRLHSEQLGSEDLDFLRREGHSYDSEDDLSFVAHCRAVAQRFAAASELNYLILVPTLRCNLSCTYCQVSRAAITQTGYDWSEETLESVLRLLDSLTTDSVKIEFQGGEPTLRPDLIRRVIERCSSSRDAQFVICTNLSVLNSDVMSLFDRDDVAISTSLDGSRETHRNNRTHSDSSTDTFERNLNFLLARYGPEKISALPTIDPDNPPEPDTLIDAYGQRGFKSIYLRPINYHGFARKVHSSSRDRSSKWTAYYEAFVRRLIERNWQNRDSVMEESYFSLCLNRIFRAGLDHHVDLRNPNPVGVDYVVIDHDGQIYPTDEARMLSRSGVIDLAIGDVTRGVHEEKRAILNEHAFNNFDSDCSNCAYQPYCGRDIIDDISRYGRIDVRRTDTAFCKRHLHLFDFIFGLVYSDDEAIRHSLRRWLRLPAGVGELGAFAK